MKTCTKCNIEKSLDLFAKRKESLDGKRSQCKACTNLYNKKYVANNADLCRKATKNWRSNNKEHIIKYDRERYEQNPEYFAKKNKEWKQANPDKNTANTARYRTRKLNATPETLTKEDNLGIAWYYRHSNKMQEVTGIKHNVDHIIPLFRGGLHHPTNLQVLPATENFSKGTKI